MPTTNINLNIDAITGVGSLNRLTKITSLIGADGSAIVTVGNSSIVEDGTTRTMSNSLGNIVFDYENSLLKSKAGGLSINGDSRLLVDTTGETQLDWENKWLFKNGVGGTYEPTKINGAFYSKFIDIATTEIFDGGGTVVAIRASDRLLMNSSNQSVLDWESRRIFSPNGFCFDFTAGGNGGFWDTTQTLQVAVDELMILGAAQAAGVGTRVLTTDNTGAITWAAGGGGGGTTTNPLTIGTGLSGTSFNGSAAVTIEIDSTVATLAGAQALSNKTGLISQWTNDVGYLTSTGITPSALTKTDDTNVTLTLGGNPASSLLDSVSLTLGWTGTLDDSRITSAATWNAKESALTFSSGVTRVVNTITNNLITGLAGGQTVVFGTAATDKGIFKSTSGNKTVAETNTFRFTSGNNGAQELLRVGDGPTGNTGELGMHAAGQSSSTNWFLRAGTNFTYFNAGTDLRLNIAGANIAVLSSTTFTISSGKIFKLGNTATTGLVAGTLAASTNASIVIQDAAGNSYRIPCII